MDEQTIQQTQESSVEPEVATLPEDEPEAVDTPAQEEEPEIGITSDGEVKFRDDFFGDYGKKEDSSNGDTASTDRGQDEQSQAPQSNADDTQRLYTPEELRATPFEQWDKSRLPKEITDYYDAVSAQLAARETQRQAVEQVRNAPFPDFLGEAPKPYTPKELVADANKLAKERLGITDDMDFDPDYEAEHKAAVDLAKAELIAQRNSEVWAYQQRAQEFNDLRDFNAQLVSMPDFGEFDKWYGETLRKIGRTNEQIQAGLYEIARTQGGHAVIRQLRSWYRMFREQYMAANQQIQRVAQQAPQVQQTPRVKRQPPKLESTQGSNARNAQNLQHARVQPA